MRDEGRLTKDELDRVNDIAKVLRRELERLSQLTGWLNRITQELDGLPHEQSYKRSRIAELIAQKVDCENNIEQLKLAKAEESAKLVKVIDDSIFDSDQRKVIVEHYCFGKGFSQIARELNFSEGHTFRLHKKGLRALGIPRRDT